MVGLFICRASIIHIPMDEEGDEVKKTVATVRYDDVVMVGMSEVVV